MTVQQGLRPKRHCLTLCALALGLLLLGCGDEDCPIGSETCACTSGGSCDGQLTCASGVCVRLGDDADDNVTRNLCDDADEGSYVCDNSGGLHHCSGGKAERILDCGSCKELFSDIQLSTYCVEDSVRPITWDGPYPFEGPGCYSVNDQLICGPVDNPPAGSCVSTRIVADGNFHCSNGTLSECKAGTLTPVVDCKQCRYPGIGSDINATTCLQDKQSPPNWLFPQDPYAGPGCYFGASRQCP